MIAVGVVEDDLRIGRLAQLDCDTRQTTASVGLTLRSDVVPSHAVRALLECIRVAAAQRGRETGRGDAL